MKQKKEKQKKHKIWWKVLLVLFAILAIVVGVFTHFGGFSTGKGTNVEEFKSCADSLENITIPDNAKVIALGEATHGNVEFQQLKLSVFKTMVENYGVRAFALEGDFGGCEQVNRYIHGGEGTAEEAAAAIGFAIYRTDEMAELISYMREYNETAADGQDLRFYGFDMQRYAYSMQFLLEACQNLGVDVSELEKMVDGEEWSADFDNAARTQQLNAVKAELEVKEDSTKAIHFADMLLENIKLSEGTSQEYGDLRDQFMADSVQWISEQEKALGFERIFIAGHNGHMAKWGSNNMMGQFLNEALGNQYYVIGTDFYKTTCNMPKGSDGKRTKQTFYSYDPLAVTAKEAGYDMCWLDFSKVTEDMEMSKQCMDYVYMGSLGEGYGWYMRLLPMSYRIFQPPATMYDSMIFVTNAHPTEIKAN